MTRDEGREWGAKARTDISHLYMLKKTNRLTKEQQLQTLQLCHPSSTVSEQQGHPEQKQVEPV
jgi:hypothetical protein